MITTATTVVIVCELSSTTVVYIEFVLSDGVNVSIINTSKMNHFSN